MAICKVDGCDRKATRKGMCQKHYSRMYRNGTLELKSRKKKEIHYCSVEGCNEIHYAKGYCIKHWQRVRRHKDPLKVNKRGRKLKSSNRITGEKIKCNVESCENSVVAKGLCMKHYKQHRRELDIDK